MSKPRPLQLLLSVLLCAAALCRPVAAEDKPDDPLPLSSPRPRAADELAAQTLIVCNQNDRDSLALAGYYREKRGIPLDNLVSIPCPRTEQISREDYDNTIAEPLRRILVERKFWKLLPEPTDRGRVKETSIRFVVLMYGMPLRVGQTVGYEGDSSEGVPQQIFSRNECAVDAELAVLGVYSRKISGILNNGYFRGDRVIADTEFASQLLVCRLDGPTPAIVKRMIDDTIATEAKGLRGFTYVDAQGLEGGGLEQGDKWLHNVARDARMAGQGVILDNGPSVFPQNYPMLHAALYYGWYAEDVSGALANPLFKFERGAVAVHLHSFSAMSLRDKDHHWCGPLLAAGAAATLGNVAEPYLALTPHLDIFAQRLREGYTFAEAGYMSQQYLSWMTTFVGDPLYRPFASRVLEPSNEWDAYRAGVKLWLEKKDRVAGELAVQEAAKRLKSGPISEALGLLELSGGDFRAAAAAFQLARANYDAPEDKLRVAIHESTAIAKTRTASDAAQFLKAQAKAFPNAEAALLLEQMAVNLEAKTNPGPAPKGPKTIGVPVISDKPAKPDAEEKPVKPAVVKKPKKK